MKIESKREKWVQICQIQGYEDIKDCYYLSNSDENRIVNRNTGKMLKPRFDKKGYPIIRLRTIDGKYKMCRIHVLKAKAFIYGPNPLDYNMVRHLDDCKTNNTLTNLAWGSQSDNMRDCIVNGNFSYEGAIKGGIARAEKLSKPVRCLETGVIYPSVNEAERQTGVNKSSISFCCRGRCQTAGDLHFEFIDKE